MPDMLRLELSRRVTQNESAQHLRLLGELEREKGPVELDATKTESYGPLGVALLASAFGVRARDGRETRLIPPTDPDKLQLFEETGLLECVAGEPAPGPESVRVASAFTIDDALMMVRGIAENRSLRDGTAAVLEIVVRALFGNALTWAESTRGLWCMGRYVAKSRSLRFAIVDRGIGIPAALRRAEIGNLRRSTDPEVMHAVFDDPSASSKKDAGESRGLLRVRTAVEQHKGRLLGLSLAGRVTFQKGRWATSTTPPFHGTAFEVELGS